MKTYKYISDTIVAVFDEDGISRMSGLVSAVVPEGALIAAADPVPEPIPALTLVEQILASPTDLAALKKALGL